MSCFDDNWGLCAGHFYVIDKRRDCKNLKRIFKIPQRMDLWLTKRCKIELSDEQSCYHEEIRIQNGGNVTIGSILNFWKWYLHGDYVTAKPKW